MRTVAEPRLEPWGADALVQRDNELSALKAAVVGAARDGEGRLIVVEGPPGIGKSALLAAASRQAFEAGLDRLCARGEPLERRYAFGVVRQLFEATVAALPEHDRSEVLSGVPPEAVQALGGGPVAEIFDDSDAEAALHHGLYWIVHGLAERRPLLLVVDDAHWADEPSLQWLVSLGRRLDDLPVALVVATRPDSRHGLDPLAATERARLLRPQPLTAASIGQVFEARLGATEPLAAELAHRRTGGNPLLLGALISALDGVVSVDRIAEIASPSIARIVRAQLASIGSAAAAMARAVAVLGDGVALRETAELAGTGLDDAASATSQLIAAEILVDAPQPAFRHSLMREAVLDGLSVPRRRAMHRRAAAMLHRDGAAVERIAAHLLAGETGGDGWAVAVLRSAASRALERGAPELAADLLTRALEEPPRAEERAGILAELGTAELRAGRPSGSDRIRAAILLHTDRREQARLSLLLGLELAGMQRDPEARAVLAEGLESARGIDDDLAMRLHANLAHVERYDLTGDNVHAERLTRLAAGVSGDTAAERLVLAMDATLRPACDAAEAVTLADRIQRAWSEGLVSLRAATGAVATYLYAGELTRAARFADELVAFTRRRSLAFGHARASTMVAMVALAAGRLADAEAALVAAVDVETYGVPRPTVGLLIEVMVERDRLHDADVALARYGADGPLPAKMLVNPVLIARARLHAANHRPDKALDDLFELGRRYTLWGLETRPLPPWRGQAAALLAMAGDAQRAHELAAEEVDLARKWGSDRALGVALRALGIVHQDVDVLRDSERLLSSTPFRLDRAHTLVELGAVQRRKGQRAAAIEPLTAGMDLAHKCGASALADRARNELLACGSRPRRLARTGRDALTASELRVARMAADGMSNRQIAQALFITMRTVTTHLGHAYQKLDIDSRGQLNSSRIDDGRGPGDEAAVILLLQSERARLWRHRALLRQQLRTRPARPTHVRIAKLPRRSSPSP